VASPVAATKVNKTSILQRLPRLSNSIWIILILALFVIVMVPMVAGYMEQLSQQSAIQSQINDVQSRTDALKLKIASQSTATAEAVKMKAELEAAKLQYKDTVNNAEVSQIVMNLAWDNDITITGMSVSQTKGKVLGSEYPSLSYSLTMTGQVANFQNFLIEAGKRLPSCQFTSVSISPATVEGELDNASISLLVYCYE
jgi:Tfp pilus assembly protein PilO